MLINDMAQLLREAGCVVTEVPGYRSNNRGQLTNVLTVVIHHTAGNPFGDYPSLAVVRDGRPGLLGPLAQLGVGRSGTVYTFSTGKANHAGIVRHPSFANDCSVGIEVESVGTGPVWPDAQVAATARAAAALCRRFKLSPARVLGHNEVCSPPGRKVDPIGIPGGMAAMRALVAHLLNAPPPQPEQENEDMPAIYYAKGDSTEPMPGREGTFGDAVFLVEATGDGVKRRHIMSGELQLALAAGATVTTMTQRDLDALPYGEQAGLFPWEDDPGQ